MNPLSEAGESKRIRTPLPNRRRSPSSVSLVVAGLLLALVAVMAMPVVQYWMGGYPGVENSEQE